MSGEVHDLLRFAREQAEFNESLQAELTGARRKLDAVRALLDLHECHCVCDCSADEDDNRCGLCSACFVCSVAWCVR